MVRTARAEDSAGARRAAALSQPTSAARFATVAAEPNKFIVPRAPCCLAFIVEAADFVFSISV